MIRRISITRNNKLLFIFLVAISLIGCDLPKYILVSEKQFETAPNTILFDKFNNVVKPIVIPHELLIIEEIREFVKVYNNDNKFQVWKYIRSLDKENPYRPFLYGLYYCSINKQDKALDYLNDSKVTKIQFLVDFLVVECEYELTFTYEQYDYFEIKNKYQMILDDYTLSEEFIKMLNIRMRYLRYRL